MKIQYKPFLLEFKHPFGVSSNTRKETPTVFLKLESEDHSGYGEACVPAYLGETTADTLSFFENSRAILETLPGDYNIAEVLQRIDLVSPGSNAAKAAIDIALHDLRGKIFSKTISQLYGFDAAVPRATSLTIGIDAEAKIEKKIREAGDFSILKIKAGTGDDKALISLIRKYTAKPLYVDVNQGWTDKREVLNMVCWLKDQGVLLVEQPMPKTMHDEMRWVTKQSPLPIFADESVQRLQDLGQLKGAFSGVNIKLMKCTGVLEALKMIDYCKKSGLKILLGCMAESSCGTSAMAQLMGFADYIDLDAPLLYKNDPFKGVFYNSGNVHLSELPGIGIAAPDLSFPPAN